MTRTGYGANTKPRVILRLPSKTSDAGSSKKGKGKAKAKDMGTGLLPTPDSFGLQAIAFDCFRMRNWHLVTMAGFFTYTHHDSDSLNTWISVCGGAKIWGIHRLPKVTGKPGVLKAWEALQEHYLVQQNKAILLEDGDVFNLFLCEGSILWVAIIVCHTPNLIYYKGSCPLEFGMRSTLL